MKPPPKTKKKRRRHEPTYRQIFNRPQIMEELLRRYATGPWADQLDFSTLEPVPARFVTKYLKNREADVIWRVKHGPGDGDWFFVFVLLELQSTVKRFMALRLLLYTLHLCEALLVHKKYLAARRARRLLPPVLPVVLYNGEKRWTAPLSLAELFKPMAGWEPPDFRYVVLDVNRYDPEELRPVSDVTSGVFLMEQSKDVEDLQIVVEELEAVVDDPELAEHVASLLGDVADKLKLSDEETPRFRNLEEIRMSLLQRAEQWPKQWMAEGEKKGEKKGRRLGQAKTLKTLARHRWGDLSDSAIERIDRADVDTLDHWTCRLLVVERLEDIFQDAE